MPNCTRCTRPPNSTTWFRDGQGRAICSRCYREDQEKERTRVLNAFVAPIKAAGARLMARV